MIRPKEPKTPIKIVIITILKQTLSITEPFHNLITAFNTRTQTVTRIPLNACCTISNSAKDCKNAAKIIIITNDGKTTPAVATIAPKTP